MSRSTLTFWKRGWVDEGIGRRTYLRAARAGATFTSALPPFFPNPSLSNNNSCRPVEGVRICEIEGTVKVIEEDVGMNSRHWHRVLENGGMGDLD
jgi:hypothetical protein